MQEETPSILRRNINYNRLILFTIIICSLTLIGMPMQINKEVDVTKTENAELSAGVTKSLLEISRDPLAETLSAGLTKHILKIEKEPQIEMLKIDTVAAAAEIKESTEETTEIEAVEVVESEPEPVYKNLDEIEISRDMDLIKTSGLSREDFCELLANFKYDYAGFYERNAGWIWDLSQEYQVNEIFMCGVFGLESLYGSNDIHVEAHNYGSIMRNGKLASYESDAEGIKANFELFADDYFNPEGKYYGGVTLDSFGDTYCPPTKECPSWAAEVYSCMKKFL